MILVCSEMFLIVYCALGHLEIWWAVIAYALLVLICVLLEVYTAILIDSPMAVAECYYV